MEGIELSGMLKALREELWKSQQEGEGKAIAFDMGDIELELQLVTSKKAGVGGSIKFWVYNADASGELAQHLTHKVKLTLTPKAMDAEGNEKKGPVRLAD
jgi:hypothetical protein